MTMGLDVLKSSVVEGRVVEDPDLLVAYETPERGERGRAAFLVEPGTIAELSVVAAWAYQYRARLVIQGANTGLVGASTPDATGSQGVLGLDRLNRIVEFSPDERAVVVEAGVRLDELNRVVGEAGLFFPIELGSNPTVGGMVATNAGGAKTIRYGDVSRHVLGLEAVLADATGSKVGRVTMLEKDNSRLDPPRLFVGSFGSLGVISRVALRLAVVPRQVATAMLAFDSQHEVLPALRSLEASLGSALSAFELISGDAMRLTFDNVSGLSRPFRNMSHGCFVLVEAITHGDDDIVERLARALTAAPVGDAVIAPAGEMWKIRHSLSEGVRSAGTTLRFDIAVPRTALPYLQEKVEAVVSVDRQRPLVTQFGHWADGGTHLQVVYRDGLLPENVSAIREQIYDLVVGELQGSFSAEHGLGPHNAEYYRKYVPEWDRDLERRIKELFDPNGVWGADPYSV